MSTNPFAAQTPGGEALLAWWHGLEEDRGSRAELRRCRTLTEVVLVPAYHVLHQKLTALPDERWNMERLPAVAGLVATVKEWPPSAPPLPVHMAQKSGDRAVVSELRFRRLLQCQTQEDLFITLRRVMGLLDKRVHIPSLANGVYGWGDQRRKEWAYAYYGRGPAAS